MKLHLAREAIVESKMEELKDSFTAYKGHIVRAIKTLQRALEAKNETTIQNSQRMVLNEIIRLYDFGQSKETIENRADLEEYYDEIDNYYDNLSVQSKPIEDFESGSADSEEGSNSAGEYGGEIGLDYDCIN